VLVLAALIAACGGVDDVLTVSGTVEIRELQLGPLTAGRVTRLLKDEGDTVRAGDTIAVLEQPGLDAVIRERRARAVAAGQRTAEVEAASADSARAAQDLARARQLLERRVIAQQQFDQLRAAAASAAARLSAVRAASSESHAARAALDATLAIRDQLTVLAPVDGIVLVRLADRGEAVGAGAPVVALGVVGDAWVRAYVGERSLPRVSLGSAVTVLVDGLEREFPGRIVEIATRAEFTPRAALTERERADLVFAIKVVVDDDPDGRLKPGLPVTLRIGLMP
jgi:HlyD family secretion protein